jgi:hypothetical protein
VRLTPKKLVKINQRDELIDRKFKTYIHIILSPQEFLYLEKLLGDLSVEVGVIEGLFTNYIDHGLVIARVGELKGVIKRFLLFTSYCSLYANKEVLGHALNIRNFYILCSELSQSVNHLTGSLISFKSYISDLEKDIEDNPDEGIVLGSDTFGAIAKT